MLPIMLQLYSVRDELAKDFNGTLKQVSEMGYKYVELALAQSFNKTAAEFKAALDKAGLTAISAHVPLRDMTRSPEEVIGFHIDIGCKYIVVPYLAEEDRSDRPNYEEVKKDITRIAEIVNKKGAMLLYHNHEFEFIDYKGKYALDDLYDSIPANLLQTQIDVCWVKVGGVNPADYILKYKGRSPIVHLKDFEAPKGMELKAGYELIGEAQKDPGRVNFPFRAVGYGNQDFPAILKAAETAGTKYLVVEQDLPSPGKTPLECAKDSLNYLNGL